jgi:ATP-dependent exoDNAse (exonuclease V) beta subunit
MNSRFDPDQVQACKVRRNAVIMAGAGSGKTSVLVERFCWLLEEKYAAVDEILALTFTRKAAAEMYERIYNRLRDSDLPHVRLQLQHFDRAQISTLDSFCSQVVRNASAMFGLASDFHYDEEQVRRCAERASLDYILSNLDDPDLETLLDLHGFDGLKDGLFINLAIGELHLAHDTDFSGLGRRQLEACRGLLDNHLACFREAAAGIRGLAPRTASISNAQREIEAAGDWPVLAAAGRYHDLVESCLALSLKKPGGKAAEDILLLKSGIDRLKREQELIVALAETLGQEKLLLASFGHLKRFQALFNRRKRESGLVSFRDIAEMSIRILLENKPLRRFYKHKFRYIMIDEFQDNNRLQKDLLYLLSESRDLCLDTVPEAGQLEADKLFFVGDEKQSIYRFRGADVGVFKALSRELESRGGQTVALNRNYRSDPGLITFFNRIFAVLMAEGRESYEARFQDLVPGLAAAPPKAEITLLYRPYLKEAPRGVLSREESEAFAVAGYIQEAVQSRRLEVRDGADRRPALYPDFAVLLRSTGNQIIYERLFRHFRIPYTTQNVRSLYLEAPLNDIYHLLQLCLWPEDRLSYAALLRSPFVNLSDHALLVVLRAGAPPFQGLESIRLEAADADRLTRAEALVRTFRNHIDTLPLSEVITRLWYEAGYRYFVLQDPRYHNYLEFYDYMTALARASEKRQDNLAAFLDFLRPRLGTPEKAEETESSSARTAGVQLMTIHKAKGLEFPVVVLADTGNRGRDHDSGHPYTVTEELGITLNLGGRNYFTLLGKEEREKKETAELKRLFYVALTRAQSHLVISGSHNAGNRSTPRALLNLLFTGLGIEAEAAHPEAAHPEPAGEGFRLTPIETVSEEMLYRRPAAPARPTPDLEVLRAGYARAAVIRRDAGRRRDYSVTELSALLAGESAGSEAVRLPSLEVDAILSSENLERNFGSLVHSLLAAGLAAAGGGEGEPDWLELGIPPRFRPACLEAARGLCDRFLASALGKLAKAAEEIRVEQPFMRRVADCSISGQIDLLFRTGQKTLLIDFKSDRVLRREEYMAQLGLYRLAASELLGRDPECYLYLLRSGETVPLDVSVDWQQKLITLLAAPPVTTET